jgi:acetyltransferase-like isoleucine patch superfamily enzyme
MKPEARIHPSAEVQTRAIGAGTTIWQSSVVLAGAVIGEDVNINAHCFVENDVRIGNRVTVKSGVYLWNGIRLEDDVFIGPNASFSNDKFPRSKVYPDAFLQTTVQAGASIGAAAVILPGLTIGRGAMIGAGAVVTRSVPPYAIVVGNPGRIVGYVENVQSSAGIHADPADTKLTADEGSRAVGVGGVKLYRLKLAQDMRGDLVVGEFTRNIPFVPQRYFTVFNVPSAETRGEHAHRECHQFLICVKGSCSVLVDDGTTRADIRLDSPAIGLHLPPMTWGVQYKYSADAVLLVFASHYYDAADYIRDSSEFQRMACAQRR